MVVRIFARHLQTLDPATEIPPPDVLPHHKRRITPYLYSPQEIGALLEAADTLAPPLRAATWRTLIGLLAVTGMRKSEACRLDRDHVDLNAATVVIEDSKFGKSRRLFLHPSTVAALRDYQRRRDRLMPNPSASSFFVSTRGTRLDVQNIGRTFCELLDAAGIAAPPRRRHPRLHDVRHGYATALLAGGVHPAIASAALGHASPGFTMSVYQHVLDEMTDQAAAAIDAAFEEFR